MFNDVGRKLMSFAKVFFWLSVFGYVIFGFYLNFSYDFAGVGFLISIFGILLFALPAAWIIYGLGQIVQDIHDGRQKTPASISAPDPVPSPEPAAVSAPTSKTKEPTFDDLPEL